MQLQIFKNAAKYSSNQKCSAQQAPAPKVPVHLESTTPQAATFGGNKIKPRELNLDPGPGRGKNSSFKGS